MSALNTKDSLVHNLSAVIDALSCIIGQNVEVVLHDLSQPQQSILKILNGHVSQRKEGCSVLQSPEHDLGFVGLLKGKEQEKTNPLVFKAYQTKVASGKVLTSSTVIYKDELHRPLIALCFNADQQSIELAQTLISQLLPKEKTASLEESEQTLQKKIDEIIQYALPPAGLLQVKATKKEKIQIVKVMQEQGLFLVRGGTEAAAKALGVTRYTIYNYLDEIKTHHD